MFYKQSLFSNISLVENIQDCIALVKFSHQSQSVYFVFCYFPPENSVFYHDNEIDLFQSLEDTLAKYKEFGPVYIAGDLNSRTGIRQDFIDNDGLGRNVSEQMEVFDYNNDVNIGERKNMDKFVNSFGRTLLSLCKTIGLRIVTLVIKKAVLHSTVITVQVQSIIF